MNLQINYEDNLRIFKSSGVEIFNEDIQYIKNNEILYISLGEDYDECSNFAQYKIIKTIGSGGFSKVYEAKNRITK